MNKKKLKQLLIGDFSFKRLLLSFVFIYVSVLLYGVFWGDRAIFLPQPSSYQDSPEIMKLNSGVKHKISAIYLPNNKAYYTILFSHGNAEDLGDIRPVLKELHQGGFSVFAYDYQGYGTSQGTPSEQNTYQDIDAAYDYLTTQLKIPRDRVLAYGRSVGGGPTVDLVSRKPVAGLILESTFISAFRVITKIPLFPLDKFTNLDKIKTIHVPVLIMHGTNDDVIPFWHGETLFAIAHPPKRFFPVKGAGHNNVMEVAGTRYFQTLSEFIKDLKFNEE